MTATGSPCFLTLRRRRVHEHTPIAVAMALSTVMQATILALIAENLGLPVTVKEKPPVPIVVVLGSPGTADDERTDIPGAEESQTPTGADRTEATRDAPAAESGRAGSAEPPGEALTPPEPIEQRAGRPNPDTFESNSEPAVIADLSTAGLIDALAQPTPVLEVVAARPVVTAPEVAARTAAFSPKQEIMLTRKIDDWAESYHRSYEPDDELVWKHEGQQYTAHFTSLPDGDDTRPDRVAVRVTTEQNGNRLSTTMRMKRLAFSNYAQFVNRWDDSVQIHDDELDGRFHSNSEINLSYSRDVAPRFRGKVTTSARTINITDRRGYRSRDEIFLGGLETGVPSIRLPRHYVPLPESMAIREEQLHEFPEDTRITFHDDGSYSWVSLESGLFERRGTIRQPASYLIATNKAELHLRGTVAGKVLVFSANRIVIIADLMYATDPEGPDSCDDYLGLVSERTVEIAEPTITGPGDLHIQGAIYARRLFRVRDYRRRGSGTLDIYGSLAAGSLTATEPRYATRIRFDPRLESRRPPGFPVTDRYELESWDAAWTVEP
jgi:hypothetical protein